MFTTFGTCKVERERVARSLWYVTTFAIRLGEIRGR